MVNIIRGYLDDKIKKFHNYYEPFIGGGPVLLSLANEFKSTSLFANDKDIVVSSFWDLLANSNDEEFYNLIERIRIQPTIDLFYRERENEDTDRLTLAYHCVLFHKTTFNGMYNGNPIGGREQKSRFKIDCHYNSDNLVRKIRTARSLVRNRLQIRNMDILEYLDEIKGFPPMYLDPPYFKRGDSLYPVKLSHKGHEEMASVLSERTNWVLSYDDCEEVRKMYAFAKIDVYPMWYSSSSFRKEGDCAVKNELIITPYGG